MFPRRDGEGIQLGQRRRLGSVVVFAQVIVGVAVLDGGGTAGGDIGVALNDVPDVQALQPVRQRGIPVEVVEIFQQPEAQRLRDVGIGFVLGQGGGHLDRHLFVGQRGLEHGLVGGVEPIHQRLLEMSHSPDLGHLRPKLLVEAGSVVQKAQ